MSACHIAGIGTAAAERVPVEALATDGIDPAELRATVGLEARHASPGDITPFQLAIDASRAALDAAGLVPPDLDVIVHVGRMRVEYFTWGLSLAVAKELGHPTVLCLDVTEFNGPSLVAGLRLLGAKFRADDRLRTALLVFPHRFSDFVDMSATEDRWLWPLSDGAGALVIRRGAGPGAPLGHAFASDGTAARAIGLRTEVVDDGPEPDGFFHHEWALAKYYFVRDPDTWPSRVEARVAERLAATIEEAAARAAVRLEDVSTVQTGFLYPGVAARLRERLRLGRRLRVHTAHGMMGGAELAFVLPGLIADPELRDRPLALAGFGLPGHFGAVIISTF
jgi:3-oxoacyl-[acyl-carrier-protein] synthase III